MTVKIETEFAVETCVECGLDFALPAGHQGRLKKNHRIFYCPSGHQQYYARKTEEDRLRDKLRGSEDELRQERVARLKVEKERDGALDRISKLKKRADAGLCPHCRRHFVNVERHIKSKHKGGAGNEDR